MNIPYRDLSVDDITLKNKLLNAVEKVLDHGRIILGPEVERFEQEIARSCQVDFAVGVGSGTDALYLALRSLGVGPGDEVITTPLSWIATTNAIALCGAKPVFVDIGDDLNINPDLIEEAISAKTKVLLPVHFTGKMCEIEKIVSMAQQHDIYVVEDAAQSFGASRQGILAGQASHLGCFSMNPMKVLGAYGEAGAITTNNHALYQKLVSLRYAGTINKEDCHTPSINGRIDTVQAAMLLVALKYFPEKIKRLREIAHYYNDVLHGIVECPEDDDGFQVYYSYTILTDLRDKLMDYLLSKKIETKIQHPILMPYHKAYLHLPKPVIPVAEKQVKRLLCIPNHEKLKDTEVEYIASTVKKFFR